MYNRPLHLKIIFVLIGLLFISMLPGNVEARSTKAQARPRFDGLLAQGEPGIRFPGGPGDHRDRYIVASSSGFRYAVTRLTVRKPMLS